MERENYPCTMERSSMMKRWFKKAAFSFLFAWRNLSAHPFRTLLLMIGFLGVSITILISISMNDLLYTYYYGNQIETYQDIDLKVAVDNDSSSRFFRTTPLQSSNIDEFTDGIYPFFEFDVLTQITEEDRVYVHVFASSIDMLSHLSNQHIQTSQLANNEVIITSSYANAHDLSIDNQILLQAGQEERYFIVKEILDDGKLFTGHSIFIDKQSSFSFFLTALDPALAEFPPILLTNIYSVLYVDIKDDVTVSEGITAFKAINEYESLDYIKAIDDVAINQLINRNIALVNALLSLVFIAIIFVLQTTLNVYFHERKANAATIHVLGGRYRYAFGILGIEIFFQQAIAFIIAVITTNISFKIGMTYLSSAWIYQLTVDRILMALGITLVVILSMFAYYAYRYMKSVDMTLIRRIGNERRLNMKAHIIIALMSLLLYGVSYWQMLVDLFGHTLSLFRILFVASFLLSFPFFIYDLCVHWLSKYKERKKTYYHMKIFSGKKGFSLYFSMTLIVSLIIFLLVFMIQHLNQREETFANEYQFDMIVTRMTGNEETIYQDINHMDNVEHANRADIYDAVEVPNQVLSIDYVISMDIYDIQTYFDFVDLEDQIVRLSQKLESSIILPIRYKEIFNYQVNDVVVLTLNPDIPEQSFIIAGFFEKQGLDVAFTNLYMIDQEVQDNANSILITAKGDRHILFNDLLDSYSKQLVVVIDFKTTYVDVYVSQMNLVKNFIIGYILVLIACFIMTLSNHQTMLNMTLEADHARMLAMGYGYQELSKDTIKSDMMILSLMLFVSTLSYLLIFDQIKGLFSAFGAYESIRFNVTSIFIGISINIVLYIVLITMRILNERKLNISKYLRIL